MLFRLERIENSYHAALYSYLAHENYLRAAHLWLVTRVVKESLAGMPEDVNGVSAPATYTQQIIADCDLSAGLYVLAATPMGRPTAVQDTDRPAGYCFPTTARGSRCKGTLLVAITKLISDCVRDSTCHHLARQLAYCRGSRSLPLATPKSGARLSGTSRARTKRNCGWSFGFTATPTRLCWVQLEAGADRHWQHPHSSCQDHLQHWLSLSTSTGEAKEGYQLGKHARGDDTLDTTW